MGNESHDFLPELGAQEGPQPGPSWARRIVTGAKPCAYSSAAFCTFRKK